MKSFTNITKSEAKIVANGSNQTIFTIDLSAYGTGQSVSIELFVCGYSDIGASTSTLYARKSETLETGDANFTEVLSYDSTWKYNQSTASTIYDLSYEYIQSTSTIRIFASNTTGDVDVFNYFYSIVLNYE